MNSESVAIHGEAKENKKDDESCKEITENVRSYGIDINRQKIKSIPENEQSTALKNLGVSAYEQEDFEEGVLQQVDEAIEEQKRRILITTAKKKLQNIQDEIKSTQEEIEKTDKAISACQGADDYHVKRSLVSLNNHKETKIKQLERLQAREKYALKDLKAVLEQLSNKDCDQKKNEVLNFDSFGVPDFDSRLLPDASKPSTSQEGLEQCILLAQSDEHANKYDRIKAKNRNINIRDEFSDSYSSEEEYMPYPDEVSDEISEEELEKDEKTYPVLIAHQKKSRQVIGKHHKTLKAKLKTQKCKGPKKVVDDGDINAYQQRIRELRLKERLKQSGDLDTILDSELSQDEENDDKEISLKGGFSLSIKMWRKLYKYQRTCIKWLWELHCQDVGGILGDEMGLGKTIQVIAFLTGLRTLKTQRSRFGPTLIACPATVLHQWVKEFHKWSPEFRVAILHDTGSFTGRKEALIKHIVSDRGVIVTSYSNLRIQQDELLRYTWEYVILDEGHKIRNPDAEITLACKQFATSHRLILSGSPLQNNLKELWSLFDFIYPGKLGTLPVFMAEFSVPITAGGYANATDVQVQTSYKCACVLRDTISPYLLRRLKKDVNMSLQLPTKNEQVLFCRLTQEQRDMYKMYINSRDVVSILAGKMKVFPGLIMLRKICNHPDLSSAAGSLDLMKQSKQSSESMASEHSKLEYENGYGFWKRSGKMIVVESLLKLWKEQNHKVLLFSQTRQMLDILESFVKDSSYTYLRMDGSTSIGSRQPTIEHFNQDKSIFIFLLTTRVGGLGVNLVGANRVIIFDPDWNPSTDTQARERSWRIGQDKHVTIYRLLTTGTIEEKIYHRQIFKQFLTNRVLKNPAQRRFFKSNDLYELFTLGDEGPRNNTETNAIFAGTGSEIKLGKKEDNTVGSIYSSRQESKKKSKRAAVVSGVGNAVTESESTRNNTTDSHEVCNENKVKIHKSHERSEVKSHVGRKDVWIIGEDDFEEKDKSNANGTSEVNRSNDLEKFELGNGQVQTDTKIDTSVNEQKFNELLERDVETEAKLNFVKEGGSAREKNDKVRNQSDVGDIKRKKKRRKRNYAKVEGTEIKYLDKHTIYKQKDDDTHVKKHDEDVLMAIFDQTGVHSALKHDRIEESGNPDYVLVEKEAERVAKQAAEALRKSRAVCRNAEIGVPTWTGNNGSAGLAMQAKRSRFGVKRKSSLKNNTDTCTAKKAVFDGSEMVGKTNSEKDDLSSANLLKKMRARKALTGRPVESDLDHNQYSIDGHAYGSREEELMKEIRHFVALRAKKAGQATTNEILEEFKAKINDTKNALFKEMLKQVCEFRKVDGGGVWFLKDSFK